MGAYHEFYQIYRFVRAIKAVGGNFEENIELVAEKLKCHNSSKLLEKLRIASQKVDEVDPRLWKLDMRTLSVIWCLLREGYANSLDDLILASDLRLRSDYPRFGRETLSSFRKVFPLLQQKETFEYLRQLNEELTRLLNQKEVLVSPGPEWRRKFEYCSLRIQSVLKALKGQSS